MLMSDIVNGLAQFENVRSEVILSPHFVIEAIRLVGGRIVPVNYTAFRNYLRATTCGQTRLLAWFMAQTYFLLTLDYSMKLN
jgi:hypothetical protein